MNRFPTLCVLLAFACSTLSCYSFHRVRVEERQQIKPPQRIYKIQTTGGNVISFASDSLGYAILTDSTLLRHVAGDSIEVIPLSTVKILHTKGYDSQRTTYVIVLSVTVAVLLSIALANQFPTMSPL
jgi:hypothetical protein